MRGDGPGADRPAPVADDRHPVGRSGRTVVAGRPHRGALRHAPAGRAGDLRRDHQRHLRRRIGAPPGGDRDAADHPRPAGDGLVAGRAAADQRGRAGTAGRRRSPRRRRFDLERRRPRPTARDGRCSRRRRGWRSATSRSSASRAGGRPSPRSSTIPSSCRTSARCDASRSPTRPTTRPARPARPTW